MCGEHCELLWNDIHANCNINKSHVNIIIHQGFPNWHSVTRNSSMLAAYYDLDGWSAFILYSLETHAIFVCGEFLIPICWTTFELANIVVRCRFNTEFLMDPFCRRSHKDCLKAVCVTNESYAAFLYSNIIPKLQAWHALHTITFMQDKVPSNITVFV